MPVAKLLEAISTFAPPFDPPPPTSPASSAFGLLPASLPPLHWCIACWRLSLLRPPGVAGPAWAGRDSGLTRISCSDGRAAANRLPAPRPMARTPAGNCWATRIIPHSGGSACRRESWRRWRAGIRRRLPPTSGCSPCHPSFLSGRWPAVREPGKGRRCGRLISAPVPMPSSTTRGTIFPYDISLCAMLTALWLGLGRWSRRNSVLVGVAAGLGFLVYNGYWLLRRLRL